MPKAPESKSTKQSAETCKAAELDGKQALFELDSDITENMSIPALTHESAESDTNSDSKNLYSSETLGKYVAYHKSIKRPKIINSDYSTE